MVGFHVGASVGVGGGGGNFGGGYHEGSLVRESRAHMSYGGYQYGNYGYNGGFGGGYVVPLFGGYRMTPEERRQAREERKADHIEALKEKVERKEERLEAMDTHHGLFHKWREERKEHKIERLEGEISRLDSSYVPPPMPSGMNTGGAGSASQGERTDVANGLKEMAAAQQATTNADRAQHLGAARGWFEPFVQADGSVIVPNGLGVRSAQSLDQFLQGISHDMASKGRGAEIPVTEIQQAAAATPPVTNNGNTAAVSSRVLVESDAQTAFIDSVRKNLYPTFQGTNADFIRAVEHEFKPTNPDVVEDGKYSARELMLTAKKLDAIGAILPGDVRTKLDDLLKQEGISKVNGVYVDSQQPNVTLTAPAAPTGPDAATTVRIIADSPAKTAFLAEAAKLKGFTGTEAEFIQSIENEYKAKYPDKVTKDGKLDVNELMLAASQMHDVEVMLPQSLKDARDALLTQENIALVNGEYVDQATADASASKAPAGPVASPVLLPATGAQAAGTHSTRAVLPAIGADQVSSLQTMLAQSTGEKAQALAKRLADHPGEQGSFGPRTMDALRELLAPMKDEQIHKLDFTKGIPDEVAKKLAVNTSAAPDNSKATATKTGNDTPAAQGDAQPDAQPQPPAGNNPSPAVPREIPLPEAHNFLVDVATKLGFGSGLSDAAIVARAEQILPMMGVDPKAINADGKLDSRELTAVANGMEQKGFHLQSLDDLLKQEQIVKGANGIYTDGKDVAQGDQQRQAGQGSKKLQQAGAHLS